MRIERLEIFGFKSFMERLILPLEHGITGVVGPNGCGKSNIIDALRWVLGETRASQLRGGVLEDVIFNGTEALRPLGLAEVSLVIRADRESLYQDLLSYYEQIESNPGATDSVSAVTLPAGEDQVPVVQLASPTVSGAPSPENSDTIEPSNFNSQNEAPSEQERTAALEGEVEAPGNDDVPVTSGDFLADIRASLSKYSWLQSVSEVQVTRRLYRSGESEYFINKVQCRLKDLKEFFRIVGLAARGYTIIAQGEIGRIVTAKAEDRRQVIEEAAHIAGFREHMNAVGKRLDDTQAQVVRLDDVIKEVTRQVANLKRQAGRAVARAELKEQLVVSEQQLFGDTLARLSRKIIENKQRVEGMALEEQQAQALYSEARAHEQSAREGAVKVDTEMDSLRKSADELKDELNKRLREVGAKESRVRELTSVVQARNTEIRRLEERKVMLLQRLHESKEALDKLEALEGELTEQGNSIDGSGQEEIKSLTASLQVLREDHRSKDKVIREMRDRLVSAQSRRDALQAQLTASSPVTHLKRALGGENKLPPEITGQFRLLVDGIKVPDRYTKALQAVLSERASFLVVDEVSKVAQAFHDLVLKADPSNKKGLGIGLFEAVGEGTLEAVTPLPVDSEGMTSLLGTIEIAPWCRGLVARLLNKVWLATDLQAAFAFIEKLKAKAASGEGVVDPDTVVVTESGDLLSPWSFYSLRHEGGVIQMKSKIDEAVRTIDENQGGYDQQVQDRDAIAAQIAAGEKRHAELVRSVQIAQNRLREIGNRQGEVRGRLQSERKLRQQIEQDIQRIEPQGEELKNQLATLQRSVTEVVDELEILKARDNSELEKSCAQVAQTLRQMEDQRRAVRESMGQLLREAELKRQALESLRDRVTRERMNGERYSGELVSLEAQVRERAGDEFFVSLQSRLESIDLLVDVERRELEARVSGMRQRLDREGEVDSTAIEQYEVENARLIDLIAQRDDLNKATETLRVTLGELAEACTKRFTATFEAIRRNFAVFGPKLFGGGSAEIALLDPTRPLETGVEITVRPPGKKPKSIDLLSGGEKALCATALVFSMFMVRPSPLCVLDEVDAPLDEANVHRFVSFIKEMSARTQFLMVTHNKQSMATADTLVGVTMPQPGASKVLTVSLQEAVKQVA